MNISLYDPFDRMRFGGDTCFLCGTSITAADTIPVFSEWLMRNYRFADKQLLLLDKSVISYRDLTIPCCPNCRSNHVNPLEQKIAEAHAGGVTAFRTLPEKEVFLWLAKMFYGILVLPSELYQKKRYFYGWPKCFTVFWYGNC